MKRILLCGILALAAGTMAFAQQWPDGFSVSGQLRTGLRGDFLGGDFYDNTNGLVPMTSADKSSFWFWHDDSGNRTQLDMKYTQENFGFRLVPRWTFNDNVASIPAAYAWFELMNDMIRITGGKIDNAVWTSPTPTDLQWGNPTGFRVEVMPVDGLNFGWAIGYNAATMGGNNPSFPGMGGKTFRADYLFGSSTFGAKYTSDMFTFAGGLELRHENLNRRTMEGSFEFGGRGNPVFNVFNVFGAGIGLPTDADGNAQIGLGTVGDGDTGISAYAGVEVKPIDGLSVQVGANAGNLDAVKEYGYIHFNEKVAYDLGSITPRIELHQKMDISDNKYALYNLSDNTGATPTPTSPDDDVALPVYMKFIPGVDVDVADNLSAYVDIPVAIWDKVFEVGVKPGVNYTFGPGLSIGCYYNLILTTNSYDADMGNGKTLKDFTAIRNAVQINFGWSF